MLPVWRALQPLMPRGNRSILLVATVSLCASAAEAAVLVITVNTALALADNAAGSVELSLPVIGDVEARPPALLGLATGLAGCSLAGHAVIARLSAQLGSGTIRAARDRVTRAFVRATWHRQASDREGALQETVTTLAQQSANLAMQFGVLITGLTALAALFGAALAVDAVVTLAVVVVGAGIFLVLRPVTSATKRRSTVFVRANSNYAEEVGAWTSMAMDLRVFGAERTELDRLSRANRDTARAMLRARFASQLGKSLYKDLALIFLVSAVGVLYLTDGTDLAAIGAVVLLIVRSLGYATQVQSALQTINEHAPNLESLVARVESLEDAAETSGDRVLDALGPVELIDAGHAYAPDRPGVAGIDLRLEPGDALGVVGPSGSGKSTLVQMLLRLRRPTSGRIEVGGVPYEEIDLDCWHRLVSLVPQEPHLFEGTVHDNIAFMRAGVTEEDVRGAAEAAHVLEDIDRLPEGFATRLGPRGSGLSGGQKQRVAIARALLGGPELLVLDEPTSALDVRSEALLQETIAELKGRVTLVIIAHRLSTLSGCDRVLVLDAGRPQLIGPLEAALEAATFLGGSGGIDHPAGPSPA